MGDYEEFDLDRSTAQAWVEFTDRLAEVLSVMDDTSDLTIGTLSTDAEPAPFVRFSVPEPHTVRAEASSNASLGERFQLVTAQLEQLDELGWDAPSADGEHASANFSRSAAQEDAAELAAQAVAVLRDVFGVQHPVFLAPDQLAEVLQPGSGSLTETHVADDDIVAIMPANHAHLDALLEAELTDLFGHPPFRDSEGDVAIRVGSTMVFVRATPDASELVVFAPLVHEVSGRSAACEVLNDLNVESRYGRFALHRDRVFVQMSVPARPFVPAHLHQALRSMSQIADGIDNQLASRLRGRTTFDEAGR